VIGGVGRRASRRGPGEAWVTFERQGDGAFLIERMMLPSPSLDANPRDCLDIKQFQDLQDRVLRVAQEDATVSDHPG
jgi:hypothetical protein